VAPAGLEPGRQHADGARAAPAPRSPRELKLRALGIGAGLLAALAAALYLTRPLAGQLPDAVPANREADVEHQLWAQWWFETAQAEGRPLFRSDVIHYPQQVDLSLADLNLSLLAAFALLERGGGWPLAWNALLLGACVLAAAAAWALARGGCARGDAAWLAAFAFAASAYWRACAANAWLYLAQTWVLPLALLAGARALRSRSARDAVVAALCAALVFHVTPIYFLYLLLLAAALAPWHASAVRAWSTGDGAGARLVAGVGVLALLVLPRAVPMFRAASVPLAVHSSPFDTHLSAGLVDLFFPWMNEPQPSPQWGFRGAYLGVVPIALGVYAWLHADVSQRRQLRPWLVSAAGFTVLAFGPYAVLGDVRVPLPGWLLAGLPGFSSLTNPWRMALPAVLCLVPPAAAGAAMLLRAADQRRRGLGLALAGGLALLHAADVGNAPPFPASMTLWRGEPAPVALALRDDGERTAVLDLSGHPKRNQRVHGRPIVSGWLPRVAKDVSDRTGVFVARVRRAPPDERADLLGRAGVGALVLSDTSGWRVRPDPARPGHFREDPIASAPDVGGTR
jgi:hypothetical protein